MDMIIICEFTEGEEFIPIILAFIHKNAYILLHFLVDTFGLWVVSGGWGEFDPKETIKFSRKFPDKLRTSVRNYAAW
jgi:hypothetical protein